MARNMIGMVVGLENVVNRDAEVASLLQIVVDLEARIDDGHNPRFIVTDHVGGAAEVVVDELTEDHEPRPTPEQTSSQILISAGSAIRDHPGVSLRHLQRDLTG